MSKLHTESRDFAFKFLYGLDIQDVDNENLDHWIDTRWSDIETSYNEPDEEHGAAPLSIEAKTYAAKIVKSVLLRNSELEDLIGPKLKNWTLKSIQKTDLTLLKMGVAEIQLDGADDRARIIDSVVDLAKKFSRQESYGFINAILDQF